jgi:hypothetical protein
MVVSTKKNGREASSDSHTHNKGAEPEGAAALTSIAASDHEDAGRLGHVLIEQGSEAGVLLIPIERSTVLLVALIPVGGFTVGLGSAGHGGAVRRLRVVSEAGRRRRWKQKARRSSARGAHDAEDMEQQRTGAENRDKETEKKKRRRRRREEKRRESCCFFFYN